VVAQVGVRIQEYCSKNDESSDTPVDADSAEAAESLTHARRSIEKRNVLACKGKVGKE